MDKTHSRQGKRSTTYLLKDLSPEYWKLVKQFAIHRDMTIRHLILTALDEYMKKHPRREKTRG